MQALEWKGKLSDHIALPIFSSFFKKGTLVLKQMTKRK